MRRSSVLSAFVLLSALACGGSSPTATGSGTSTSGPMSATIGGVDWASPTPRGSYKNGIVAIAGLDLALTNTVTLAVAVATAPGTYSLSYGNTNFASGSVARPSGAGWTTGVPGGVGTVTFTVLTATRAAGTFAFDAVPSGTTATGTIHVTNGKFDVTF
jgi:hypothetical protein